MLLASVIPAIEGRYPEIAHNQVEIAAVNFQLRAISAQRTSDCRRYARDFEFRAEPFLGGVVVFDEKYAHEVLANSSRPAQLKASAAALPRAQGHLSPERVGSSSSDCQAHAEVIGLGFGRDADFERLVSTRAEAYATI